MQQIAPMTLSDLEGRSSWGPFSPAVLRIRMLVPLDLELPNLACGKGFLGVSQTRIGRRWIPAYPNRGTYYMCAHKISAKSGDERECVSVPKIICSYSNSTI